MSFFSDFEIDSLRIARMSLHIVGDDEFVAEPELPIEHDDFLLDRIKAVASDAVYRFQEASTTKKTIEDIASRNVAFEAGSQELARDFCRLHSSGTKDGAFFVFELGTDEPDTVLYALMKYDYNQALELVNREGTNGLRRIVEAFIGDRSAIQKSAIVRVIGGSAELAVSTRDRMGRPSPQLTDYFIRYLQVERDRSDSELTSDIKEVVKIALQDNREHLPAGGVAAGVSRAMDVLRNAPTITEDVLAQAVWVGAGQPAADSVRDSLDKSVERMVKRKRLVGVSFPPDASLLGRPVRRVIKTEEGVTIEYNTGLEGQAVRIVELENGGAQFVVTTKRYTDAVPLENPSRQRR